ncbi:hypothetical protein CCR85_08910 [Rhodothalassium salexigens]|uniref:tetratricopeptide repeat protein n=1 Tax=Rhodothalassium salexigens TaxID=1086 RepID=UPI0019114B3F|nr:tetratricopeptide repeat protein [Rhodothalassium salexigens]MBK5911607.1 hypothetical protein [Rhodothalassium salexigens]MBK5920900.1 hypothetical protein [Rhodothalassium salexigens]
MSDIFREVDEEVRKDQTVALLKRYGPILGILAVLIVAGVAGWQIWQSQHEAQLRAASDRYVNLVETLASADAGAIPEAVAEAELDAGYGALLSLRTAAADLAAGDATAAVAVYDRLAAGGTEDPVMRDFARLQAARALLSDGDTEAVADRVIVRLEPLSGGTGVMAGAALELLAVVHMELGDWAAAEAYLERLGEFDLPGFGVQQRRGELMALVRDAQAAMAPEGTAAEDAAPAGDVEAPGADTGPTDDATQGAPGQEGGEGSGR